ncbi:hypothetical protein RND81_08G126000 [Saponaria officinalis]|uniref:Uncharacterized protein n=1 Tax=Saponaria officinalis TaxID=3572 RepID=A0AAW1J5S2_SAPOF
MSSSSTITTNLSLDHHHLPPSDHLCYLHCTRCDTVLAVSVPASSLYKAVTVRCGHCGSLLPLNHPSLLAPAAGNQLNMTHHNPNLFSSNPHNNLMGGMTNQAPNYTFNQPNVGANNMTPASSRGGPIELPKPPSTTRPPEKRQRVPSAYNRFIKDEIQRIKAGNPDISHREAFSAAAKNWAHFPHIHFGLMPDQTVKRTSNIRPHHPQCG